MIRVLHVVASMNCGGVEKLLFNYYDNINREKIQFDFACYSFPNGKMRKKFQSLDSKIYELPPKKHFLKNLFILRKILKNNEYDIIHVHQDEKSWMPLFSALIARIKIRILHVHLGLSHKNLIFKINKMLSILFSNARFACSKEAGDRFFGCNNYYLMKNGVDYKKYIFDENIRNFLRSEYSFEKKDIVIGTIGRFTDQKNYFFALSVIKKLVALNKNIKYVMIGQGKLKKDIITYVEKNYLQKNCFVLDEKENIEIYYNMFDLFILPSKYEGLGIVYIEAQLNGLPTYGSTAVPLEANISGELNYLPITDENLWVDKIKKNLKNLSRNKNINISSSFEYNIKRNASNLLEHYEKLLGKKNEK